MIIKINKKLNRLNLINHESFNSIKFKMILLIMLKLIEELSNNKTLIQNRKKFKLKRMLKFFHMTRLILFVKKLMKFKVSLGIEIMKLN